MDLNLNLDFPKPINKLLNPIAKSAGETLANVWNGCFASLNTWSHKQVFKNEQALLEYKRTIELGYASIPQEHRINPRLSIIGPAIEASKYYIEEEVIRNMFAKLITADMDCTKRNLVHHSYVEILKQMSPLDAKILAEYNNPTVLLRCTIKRKCNPNLSPSITDIYLSETFNDYDQSRSISISNLNRLGLISIPSRNMDGLLVDPDEPNALAMFRKTTLYKEILENCANPLSEFSDYQIITYCSYITELGFSFRDICL